MKILKFVLKNDYTYILLPLGIFVVIEILLQARTYLRQIGASDLANSISDVTSALGLLAYASIIIFVVVLPRVTSNLFYSKKWIRFALLLLITTLTFVFVVIDMTTPIDFL